MKKVTVYLIFAVSVIAANAQNVVYEASGKKHRFTAEDIDIEFEPGLNVAAAPRALPPPLLAILPALTNVAFNVTQQGLENNIKKFSGEYTKQKSNISVLGDGEAPGFTLRRQVDLGSGLEDALTIHFTPTAVGGAGAFVYSVDRIVLAHSTAKSRRKFLLFPVGRAMFDYTIELKVTIFNGEEKKELTLAPIVISSVRFGSATFTDNKHRSDIISIPDANIVTEVSLRVVETNPAKVRAEKILQAWEKNKDDIKTIINNILPTAEEEAPQQAAPSADNTATSSTRE